MGTENELSFGTFNPSGIPKGRIQRGTEHLSFEMEGSTIARAIRRVDGMVRDFDMLDTHFLRVPAINHDYWHAMYVSLLDHVVKHNNDANQKFFFDAHNELVLDDATTDEERVNTIINEAKLYMYAVMYLIANVNTALLMLGIKGFEITGEAQMQLKFKTLATIMNKLADIPIHSTWVDTILKSSAVLVSSDNRLGTRLTIPMWLGPDEAWFEDALPDSSGLVLESILGHIKRPPTIGELSKSTSVYRTAIDGTTSLDVSTVYPRSTYDSAPSAFLNTILKNIQRIADGIRSRWYHNSTNPKKNILLPTNYFREYLFSSGWLNSTFSFQEYANQFREDVPIVDAAAYWNMLRGFAGSVAPMLKPARKADLTLRSDKGLYNLHTSPVLANTRYDMSSDQIISTALSKADAFNPASADYYDLNIPEIPFVSIHGTTPKDRQDLVESFSWLKVASDGKVYLTDDVVSHTEDCFYRIAGIDLEQGADQPASGYKIYPDHFSGLIGSGMFVENMRAVSHEGRFYTDKDGSAIVEGLLEDNNVRFNRVAFDAGILLPTYTITPIKDVNDPFMWGTFPVLEKEDVNKVNSWTHLFANAVNLFTLDTAQTYNSETLAIDSNVVGNSSTSLLGNCNQILGPFLGDGATLTPSLYFSRLGLGRVSLYKGVGSLALGSPMSIPTKPIVRQIADAESRLPIPYAHNLRTGISSDYGTIDGSADLDTLQSVPIYDVLKYFWKPWLFLSDLRPHVFNINGYPLSFFERNVQIKGSMDPSTLLGDGLKPVSTPSTVSLTPAVTAHLDAYTTKAKTRSSRDNGKGGKNSRKSFSPKRNSKRNYSKKKVTKDDSNSSFDRSNNSNKFDKRKDSTDLNLPGDETDDTTDRT